MKYVALPWRAAPVTLAITLLLSACADSDPQAMLDSARQYSEKNDNPAAIIQLKNALQQNPDLAEARFMLGKILLANGDPVGSETELLKARELGYDLDEVAPLLVRSRMAQGQFSKVTAEFGKVRLTSPQANAELMTLMAVAWRQQGDQAASQSSLQEALKIKPDHAPALVEQARFRAAQRDFDGALGVLDSVLTQVPGDAEALKLRGDILLYGKQEAGNALAAYRAAAEARPNYQDAQAGVIRVLLNQGNLDEAQKEVDHLSKFAAGRPQTLYLQAQLAFQKGDFQAARERAQQLLRLTPESPAALEMAGVIESQQGSLVQAEALLARAVQAAPHLRIARRALVLTYLRTGQADRAVGALPANLATDDSDAAMLSLAGQAYMVQGDVEKAQQYLARATRLDPNDPSKRTSLALSRMALGNAEMALEELRDVAAADTGVVADMALINTHMRARDVDKALAAIDALEKKQANQPLPWHLRGRALLLRNDTAGARKAFERALSIDPDYFAATAGLAALDIVDKKPQDAQKRLEAEVQRKPSNARALVALAELRSSMGGSPQEVADLLGKAVDAAPADQAPRVMLVEHHLRQNDAKSALTAAQTATAVLPNSSELVDALGRAQTANGEYNQAMSSFNKLVGMLPNSPLPYLRIATVNALNKDGAAVEQNLRKALEIQPDLLQAQRGLVELLLQGNRTSEALEIGRTVQKQRPREAAGFLVEGDIHMASKNWDRAAAAYRSGLQAAPSAELAIKLHTVLNQAGKPAEADRVTADWLRERPQDPAVLLYMGDRAIGANKLTDAQRYYERLLAAQPNNALALNNMAWVAGRLGRADALTLAEKANELAPSQPAFMDTLAMLLSERNEHARALELQKKVVELRPNVPLFKLNLAKIHLKAGDKGAAKPLLEELGALGDKFSGHAEVAQLKQGL